MKKTVCILTYYRVNSHGAKLQAVALYHYILNLGLQPVMLDVRASKEANFLIPCKLHHFQYCISFFYSYLFCKKYMPSQTRKFRSPSDLTKSVWDYDYYIVGSDQVWNPVISRDFSNAFFFDFLPPEAKKISYAASFGASDLSLWKDWQIEDAKRLIKEFSAISVRESQGLQMCKKEFGVDAVMACDPTFLMGASFFRQMIPHPEKKSGGGVVCFKLTKVGKDLENAFAELTKIYGSGKCIAGGRRGQKIPGLKMKPSLSTPEWLQSIYSADFVVTDSFHGTVFSIMFHKPFLVTVGVKERLSRIIDLLKYFNFSSRLCLSDSDILKNKPWETEMDFSATDQQIEILRKTGTSFLDEALR